MEAPSFTVRDSAGVEIVESRAPQWRGGEGRRLSAEPLLRIGPQREGPEYELWQVTSVWRFDDGAIGVLNSGSNEVRVYSAEGHYLETYGSQGPGPGEFERAWGMVVNRDTMMVLDWPGSVTYFERGAGFVYEVGRPTAFDGPYSLDYALPDGSALARRRIRPATPPVGSYRPQFEIVRGTRSGDLMTFGVYGGILQERIGEGRSQTNVVPPFAPTTWYNVSPKDSVVAVGDNAAYSIKVFDLDGRLRRIVRRAEALLPVTDQDIEAWKEVQRGLDWTKGQLPHLEEAWSEVTVPMTKPAFGSLAFSRSGELWVGSAEIDGAPVSAYSVFDEQGAWLGDVPMPPGLRHVFREVDIGARFFVGVWVDESGLEEVRAYAIE